jgi:Tol biopolymer transport system component
MSDDLRRRLESAPVPHAAAAATRARTVVGAAARERSARRRRHRALATVLVLGGALAAAGTPGAAVGEWVQRQVGSPAPPPAQPAAEPAQRLPAAGRLLVRDARGLQVVGPRGDRVRLGHYDGATWSPRGLFLAAWSGTRLTALTPAGEARWSIAAPAPIHAARWSPDGYRIAYVTTAGELRVVAGDGSGDRRAAAARAVAPAWRPGRPHTLAYAAPDGRILVRDADGGAARAAGGAPAGTRALTWAAGGRRLAAVAPRRIAILRPGARRPRVIQRPAPGARFGAAAYAPRTGQALAYVMRARGRSTLIVGREVFSTRSRITALAWSADARWLMLDARDAGQLIAVRIVGRPRILSYPGGRLDGWSP